MAANIINPGYRSDGVQAYHREIPSFMNYLKHTLGGAIAYVEEWLWGKDGRFLLPTSKEELLSYRASDVKAWIHPQLTSDYLELSLVGDFNPDAALPLILNTFGALPERDALAREVADEVRAIDFPPAPSHRTFTYTSKVDKAAAIVAYKIPPIKEDIRLYRRINLLTNILSNRLFDTIRKELGESYTPFADADASSSFHHGYIWAESDHPEPDNTGKNSILIVDIAESLSASMTEDEFIRAKKPLQSDLEESLRNNRYWLFNVMWESQQKPWKLDWSRERDADFDSITLDELKILAAQYLVPSNAVRIEVLPVTEDVGDEEDDGSARDLRQILNVMKSDLTANPRDRIATGMRRKHRDEHVHSLA